MGLVGKDRDTTSEAEGVRHWPGLLDRAQQQDLADAVRAAIDKAPLFTPRMPRSGRPFSVRMSNCGALGWVSDKELGYRYEPCHPETGRPWPPIPEMLLTLWAELAGCEPPEACLINYYGPKARLGLHRDEDEEEPGAPLLSVSLGDSAVFRLGGLTRRAPSRRLVLASGDVLALGGPARFAYHGIDRIIAGSSPLLSEGGRFNLTLRRVRAFSRAASC